MVVVNWDHEGDDFITALDKNTGRELWHAAQQESSRDTPLIVDYKGAKQVIVNATPRCEAMISRRAGTLGVRRADGNAIPCSVADAETV